MNLLLLLSLEDQIDAEHICLDIIAVIRKCQFCPALRLEPVLSQFPCNICGAFRARGLSGSVPLQLKDPFFDQCLRFILQGDRLRLPCPDVFASGKALIFLPQEARRSIDRIIKK